MGAKVMQSWAKWTRLIGLRFEEIICWGGGAGGELSLDEGFSLVV